MTAPDWRVTLALPAENRYLHIIRLTAAGAAAEAGLDTGEIEDVKIAVDELCSVAFDGIGADTELTLDFLAVEGGLAVQAAIPGEREPEIDELGRAILEATVDSIELDHASLGGGFRVVKRHRGP